MIDNIFHSTDSSTLTPLLSIPSIISTTDTLEEGKLANVLPNVATC